MRLIRDFMLSHPWNSALLVGLLFLAGLADGLGLSAMMPMLNLAFDSTAGATAGATASAAAGAPAAPQADAGAYAAAWGPAVGTRLPLLAAQDHDGRSRDLENLAGRQGLLLFLYRSADW